MEVGKWEKCLINNKDFNLFSTGILGEMIIEKAFFRKLSRCCWLAGLALASLPFGTMAQKAVSRIPQRIIFDTDMGPDYDDVGAISILHALADSGKCTILATMGCNQSPYIAATLDVLNTYFKRPDCPVGVVRGPSVRMAAPQKWDSLLVANYPHDLLNNDQAEDALTLYRKILAAQPDHSVTIVSVGFFTNLSNLLNSPADTFSPLTGKELVRKKVNRLVSMAGRFDKEMGKFKEFNVVKDAASAQTVFEQWPGTILFSGFEIGLNIHTGLPIANSDLQHSPVKDVFARCIPLDPNDAKGRMSWDETAVLAAVAGPAPYFSMVKGKIIAKPDGSNGWNPGGKIHRYLVQLSPIQEVEKVLNQLIEHQPQ